MKGKLIYVDVIVFYILLLLLQALWLKSKLVCSFTGTSYVKTNNLFNQDNMIRQILTPSFIYYTVALLLYNLLVSLSITRKYINVYLVVAQKLDNSYCQSCPHLNHNFVMTADYSALYNLLYPLVYYTVFYK